MFHSFLPFGGYTVHRITIIFSAHYPLSGKNIFSLSTVFYTVWLHNTPLNIIMPYTINSPSRAIFIAYSFSHVRVLALHKLTVTRFYFHAIMIYHVANEHAHNVNALEAHTLRGRCFAFIDTRGFALMNSKINFYMAMCQRNKATCQQILHFRPYSQFDLPHRHEY